MGADILERLDFMLISRRSDEDAIIRDARAEIVRLRGEVEALRQCGIKYLGWLGVKDAENGLRKDMADPEMVERPAPAMPNGVEDIDWPFTYIVPDSKHEYVPKHHAERKIRDALRAADNRDAAGVCDRVRDLLMERRNRLMNSFGGTPYEDGRVQQQIDAIDEQLRDTPAAVPAGEAVAWIRDNLPESLHGMGVVDVLQLLLDGGIAAEKDLIDAESPQPADGEAVALWISRHWREDLGRDSVVSVVNREDSAHTLRIYVSTTPPAAPVQAAPQEGEVLPRELVQWMRARDILPDEPFTDADLIAALNNHEVELLAAHPFACELGAVRGLVAEWRQTAEHMRKINMDDKLPHADPYDQCAEDLEAALQHRGDSRGGEAV